MSEQPLKEHPLQFGEGGRLFGILTEPRTPCGAEPNPPLFVFLNAGSLHRVGPFRLHVCLARDLSKLGFYSLRVDLAGNGDSQPRPGMTNQQSVEADFEAILAGLEKNLTRPPLVLAGLCSGADNTVRLTLKEPRVVGMVLLDPICFLDRGFRLREAVARYANPTRQVAWLKRRFNALTEPSIDKPEDDASPDPLTFRDLPTREQLQDAFEVVGKRGGRVLSIFTDYAHGYYNKSGQLGQVLGIHDYLHYCTELFWPQADHTYKLELQRRQLIEEVKSWAGGYLRQ